jgi:muramoyltetrapeptide carboxypeptidase
MPETKVRIGVVAPANRFDPAVAAQVVKLAGELYPGRVELRIHPQCHLAWGHFAGGDAARAEAFVETANDPTIDAVWFARGGYGSCRIAEAALPKLNDAAKRKIFMGYSDMGTLLAALYARGFPHVTHGPMPNDIAREGGETAIRRALAYLVDRDPGALEPSLGTTKTVAFNIKTFGSLLGTPLQPDLAGHVLMLEDVSEYMYAIDRAFFHITSNPGVRRAAGIRLGRCSQIPTNDPDFGQTEEEVAQHWCKRSGIAYLGRADIGHDAGNKVVPFGAPKIA